MKDILGVQTELAGAGRSYAVATIVDTGGSTPRTSGKMVITEDGAYGTVGGGAVEQAVARDARECIKSGANAYRRYDLRKENEGLGMMCGGEMSVLIEVYIKKPLIVICGGGHVGSAVVRLAKPLGYATLVIDDRDAADIAEAVREADGFIKAEDYRASVTGADIAAGAYFVIATHGHAGDGQALLGALTKSPAYIGMIGSYIKIRTLYDSLVDAGAERVRLDEVYAPIGLDTGGQTPEEIALSVMAEISAVRYGRSGRHLRDIRREQDGKGKDQSGDNNR